MSSESGHAKIHNKIWPKYYIGSSTKYLRKMVWNTALKLRNFNQINLYISQFIRNFTTG